MEWSGVDDTFFRSLEIRTNGVRLYLIVNVYVCTTRAVPVRRMEISDRGSSSDDELWRVTGVVTMTCQWTWTIHLTNK